MPMKKRTCRERAQRAEVAWKELELGSDGNNGPTYKERIYRVLDGLTALDEEHQRVKYEVEDFIEALRQQYGDGVGDNGLPETSSPLIDDIIAKLTAIINRSEKTPCLTRTPAPQRPAPKAIRTSRSSTSKA